ncbi:E3 ubiquitin-protein ligase BRE1B [Balamuthia mandrillaris]
MMKRKLAQSSPRPPKKAHNGFETEASGSNAPLDANEEKLLKEQNKALYHALQAKNQEIASLKNQNKHLEERQAHFDNTLGLVKRKWDMLDEMLQLLLVRYGCDTSVEEIANKVKDEKPPSEDKRSLLQLLLGEKEENRKKTLKEEEEEEEEEEPQKTTKKRRRGKERMDVVAEGEQGDKEKEEQVKELQLQQKVDNALEERIAFTKDVLIRLCDYSQATKEKNEEVYRSLAEKAADAELAKENESLRNRMARLEENFEQLQFHLSMVTGKQTEYRDGWLQSEQRLREVSLECEDAKFELQSLRMRSMRLKEEVEYLRKERAAAPSSSASSSASSFASASSGGNTEQRGGEIANDEMERLRDELSDSRMREETRLNEIKQLRHERTNVLKEIAQLRSQVNNPSDAVVVQSQSYQLLHREAQLAVMDLETQRNMCAQLQRNLLTSTQQWRAEKEAMEQNLTAQIEELMSEVSKRDSTLARIRGERDSLAFTLDQKKARQPSIKVIAEYKHTITDLKGQVERLKQKCEAASQQQNGEKKNEEDKEKETEMAGTQDAEAYYLKSKITNYKKQLQELTQKEREWSEKYREVKILLECYQSQPKEQRDLVELRKSEKLLKEEKEEVLARLQLCENDKQALEQDKESTKYQQLLEQKKELSRALAKSEQTIAQLSSQLEGQKSQAEAWVQEIEAIGSAYEDMQEQNTRLLNQLTEKDDANTKLMAERIKSEQLQHLMKEEKNALLHKMKLASEETTKLKEVLSKETEKMKTLESKLASMSLEAKQASALLETYKRAARESSEQLAELKIKYEHLNRSMAEFKKKLDETLANLESQENKNSRLEEDYQNVKRKLERVTGRGTVDSMLEEELASVKKVLRCPVCNDRLKDTVITRCMHVFCSPCIQKNLSTRHRKCPGCGKSFGEKDVQSIYLGFEQA